MAIVGCASKVPQQQESDPGVVEQARTERPVGEQEETDKRAAPHRGKRPRHPARVREGQALALSVAGDALYVADEDQARLRIIPLPLSGASVGHGSIGGEGERIVAASGTVIDLGGRPAAVLVLADHVLVTLRDPGALVFLVPDEERGLVEKGRVSLPADAWGLAVTPDEGLALVTSAWEGKVSAVDLGARRVMWTVAVAREPRGVVVRKDGKAAYVTHLIGPELTRIDGLDGDHRVRRVRLPANPLRTKLSRASSSSLGYAAVLSPDGRRLFAPRRSLAAAGAKIWAGVGTVDVLLTANDAPLLEPTTTPMVTSSAGMIPTAATIYRGAGPFVQPRAARYRRSTNTLLVACEGTDALAELDALAADPSFRPLRHYRFARQMRTMTDRTLCGAPSGIALSEDEKTAYVLCRTSNEVAAVHTRCSALPPGFHRSTDRSVPGCAQRSRSASSDADARGSCVV